MIRFTDVARMAAAALLISACDDGDGGGTVVDATVDRGFVLGDARPTDMSPPPADAGPSPMDLGGPAPDDDAGPGNVGALPCDRASDFGLQRALNVVAGADGGAHAPRVARLAEGGWALAWQTANGQGQKSIWVRAFDAQGAPRGDAVQAGTGRLPEFDLLSRGEGLALVWLSARTIEGGFDGIMVQGLTAAGALDGEPAMLQGTFDVESISAAWVPQGQGMVVYTRGRQGAGGVFAQPIATTGALTEAPVQLSAVASVSPAVAAGDEGTWGVAWLDRTSENPSDLMFLVVDDFGEPFGEANRQADAGAQGEVEVAFGRGTYAVGWARVDGLGTMSTVVTLYDTAGDVLATPNIDGPQGFGTVTDVAWLDPDTFGIAWQDVHEGRVTVGLTRVTTRGQVTEPLRLPIEAGHTQRGLVVTGSAATVMAFVANDPMPPREIGFSAEAQVLTGPLGPCR
jgi:hypothetical protein